MTEQLSVTCYNAQQAHQAMTSQIWPMLKALTTSGKRVVLSLKPETRSARQNRLLHALIGDVSKQSEWMGRRRTADEWKVLFVSGHSVATKHGAELVPGLEGEFCNIRESTANMGSKRVNSLIEYIYAWGALHDIEWREASKWTVDADTGEYLDYC